MSRTALLPSAWLALWISASAVLAVAPPWTGTGSHRVLVRVDPVNISPRTSDDLVARYPLNFTTLVGAGGQADLSTLQVHKYSIANGSVETYPTFDNAASPYDRPCRFDDSTVPDAYPDRVGYASDHATGRPPITSRQRGGRLFNRDMVNSSGHLVWSHTQTDNLPSYYAIYFDAKGAGGTSETSPAPWIGDVDVYRLKEGTSLAGLAHFTAAVGDLNGDGLFDIIAGAEKGDLMWFPNKGTAGNPIFTGCRMVLDSVGPVDLGWYAAPFIIDWDDDGRLDLLVGTSHNVILWWKNNGTATSPAFVYQGFVQADGAKLQVPQSPVPEDISGSFGVDYYNQPWVGDWNADGLPDILTGGYTTGRIFFYRCTGRNGSGVPILTYAGPVQADGVPIDTGWGAAPTAYDFDGDGKLELMTGSWAFGQTMDPSNFLMYFRNLGTQQAPNYTRAAFPRTSNFPAEIVARASVVQWNGDGLPDLLVSSISGRVRVFLHDGTALSPHWRVDSAPLTGKWGFVTAPSSMSVAQWDVAGPPELLSGATIYGWESSIHSPHLAVRGTATVGGAAIWHEGPGYGDPYNWNVFADWDRDGKLDILSGTQQGNLYYHRNLGAPSNLEFAPGIKLTLTNGQDLKVGPPVYANPNDVPNFTDLQGSRMIMAVADFDDDGIDDVAITETYGNIWIFRNTVLGGTNTLQPGVVVRTVSGRLDGLDVVDWDRNGKPDLVTALSVSTPGSIFINQSSGAGNFSFASPISPLNLPFCFWGPIFQAVDWNSDGDQDFLIRSEFYYFWAERSFVEHGYRTAVAEGTPEVQTGACCFEAGACTDGLTATICGEQGGSFSGADSTCGEIVCASACGQPFADDDRDNDVDLDDFAVFQACMTGANDPHGIFDPERCGCFDRGLDQPFDGDIDGSDLVMFRNCLSGAGAIPPPDCGDAP